MMPIDYPKRKARHRSRRRNGDREERAPVPSSAAPFATSSSGAPRSTSISPSKKTAPVFARALAKRVNGRVKSFPQFLTYKVIAGEMPEIDIATARKER